MRNTILYFCEKCRAEMAEAYRLIPLPTADKSAKARPCDNCKKLRHGNTYRLERKERLK